MVVFPHLVATRDRKKKIAITGHLTLCFSIELIYICENIEIAIIYIWISLTGRLDWVGVISPGPILIRSNNEGIQKTHKSLHEKWLMIFIVNNIRNNIYVLRHLYKVSLNSRWLVSEFLSRGEHSDDNKVFKAKMYT